MLRPFLRRVAACRRGAAALEFALIAPLLMTLYFGLAEYCQAMMADRKASHVAASVGDLVAQSTSVSTSDMSDIFSVGRTLIAPFPTSTLKQRITSVTVNSSNVAKVDWSDGSGLTALGAGSTVTLPANTADSTKPFVAAGETVIMAEAQYTYDSPVRYLLKNGITFTEVYYLRPRKSSTVARTS